MIKKGYSKKNTFNPNANKIPSLIPGMKAIGIHLIKASFEKLIHKTSCKKACVSSS